MNLFTYTQLLKVKKLQLIKNLIYRKTPTKILQYDDQHIPSVFFKRKTCKYVQKEPTTVKHVFEYMHNNLNKLTNMTERPYTINFIIALKDISAKFHLNKVFYRNI